MGYRAEQRCAKPSTRRKVRQRFSSRWNNSLSAGFNPCQQPWFRIGRLGEEDVAVLFVPPLSVGHRKRARFAGAHRSPWPKSRELWLPGRHLSFLVLFKVGPGGIRIMGK